MVADLERDHVLGLDDHSGDMWRYPVRTNDTDHLPENFNFDVREFVVRLDALLAMLGGAVAGIDAALDHAYEAISDASPD